MNYEFCDGYTYTIKKGDTLYEISRTHKVPLSLLLRSNPYVDVFNLQVGDTLCIPVRKQEDKKPQVDMSDKPQNEVTVPTAMPVDKKPEDVMKWRRYVVNTGDTLEELLDNKPGYAEMFIKKNGLNNIYLLPGIAYYVPDDK